jgi:hypothetical protein
MPWAKRASIAAIGILAVAGVASAQNTPPVRRDAFELRPFAGAFVPTGDQRDRLRDASTSVRRRRTA